MQVASKYLIWMDTNVRFLKEFDVPFFDFVQNYDVSYIWRTLDKTKSKVMSPPAMPPCRRPQGLALTR